MFGGKEVLGALMAMGVRRAIQRRLIVGCVAPMLVCGAAAAFPSLASAELGHCELLAGGQPGQLENVTALDIHNPLVGDGTITEWGFTGTLGGNGKVYLDIFKPGFETHPELAGQTAFTTTEEFGDETVYVPSKIPVLAGEGFGVTVTAGPDSEGQPHGNVAQVYCTSGDEGSGDSYLDVWESPFHTGLVPNKEGPGEVQIYGGKFEYDQPVITSVEPESGPAAGGTEVTIHGEHLAYGSAGFPESATKVAGQSPALHEDTELKVITPEAVTGAASELSFRTYAGTVKHKFTYIGTPRSRTPQLVLDPVTNITENSAQLHATVNVEGLIANYEDEPGTYCYFGYGAVEVEEETDQCEPLPEAFSETEEPVSTQLEGLAPGTTYHYLLEVRSKYILRSGHAETDDTASFKTLGIGEKPKEETKETEKPKEVVPPPPTKELIATIVPPKGLVATIPVVGLVGGSSLTATTAGVVPIKVSCPVGESACAGSITLKTIGAVTAGAAREAKKAVLILATGSFRVAGGKTATVSLHLSAKARALLKRTHILHTRATIVAHDSSGATHTTVATITVRAAKVKH